MGTSRQWEHRANRKVVPTAPSVKISRPIETSITPTGSSHHSNGNVRRPGNGTSYQRENRAKGSSAPTATLRQREHPSPQREVHIAPTGTSDHRVHRANGNIAPTATKTSRQREDHITPTETSHRANGNIPSRQREHHTAL